VGLICSLVAVFLEAKELEVFGDDSACRVLLVAMEILGVDGWWRWP